METAKCWTQEQVVKGYSGARDSTYHAFTNDDMKPLSEQWERALQHAEYDFNLFIDRCHTQQSHDRSHIRTFRRIQLLSRHVL